MTCVARDAVLIENSVAEVRPFMHKHFAYVMMVILFVNVIYSYYITSVLRLMSTWFPIFGDKLRLVKISHVVWGEVNVFSLSSTSSKLPRVWSVPLSWIRRVDDNIRLLKNRIPLLGPSITWFYEEFFVLP